MGVGRLVRGALEEQDRGLVYCSGASGLEDDGADDEVVVLLAVFLEMELEAVGFAHGKRFH